MSYPTGGGQAPHRTPRMQQQLLQQFQQPRLQSHAPHMTLAAWQRMWNNMTPCQRQDYHRTQATHMEAAMLQMETYLRPTGGLPANTNAAAAQHQRQIYEQQMAQRNAALEHQLAQRRARKPTDRNMPEGMEDLVIGDGAAQYKELRDIEKKLDYAMMRKRLDMQDTVTRSVKRQKTMRIWISNMCENQPWQRPPLDENSFDFNSGADATYKVKIEGKLIEDPEDNILESDDEDADTAMADSTAETKKSKNGAADHKFTHYFKSISVEFDKLRSGATQNPNIDPSMQIEWKKSPQQQDVDAIEFTRKGDENLNITISLVRDEQLERYRLSQALAGTLDMEEADRAEVVMGIWEYVKAMGLQEDEERRLVRCDERLKGVWPHFPPTIPPKLYPY
jgi:SWI/SNF-related matrix-associated actin-dependent regulator of chromatin subfamily D